MGTPKGTTPWNKGTGKGWVDSRGYRWVYVNEAGRRRARREHRVVMERLLGRRLEPWEIVHHRDGNPSNNAPDNLEVMDHAAHTVEHHRNSRHRAASKRTMEAFGLVRQELIAERRVRTDLLAALEATVAMHETGVVSLGTVRMARAALAKATGLSPVQEQQP